MVKQPGIEQGNVAKIANVGCMNVALSNVSVASTRARHVVDIISV